MKRLTAYALVATAVLTVISPASPVLSDISEVYRPVLQGACRTAENTQGTYVKLERVSLKTCKFHCSDAPNHDKTCYGIEYNSSTGYCELHTTPLSHGTGTSGPLKCYVYQCALDRTGKVC